MNRFGISLLLVCATAAPAWAGNIDASPINYSTAQPKNRVEDLIARVEAGKLPLPHEKKFGYLRTLLKELNVPESSQVLVFSKTSLQRRRIGPGTPRAVYFNDDVYIGFCQNGDVGEISAVDSKLGTVFYTIDQKSTDKPRFTRQGESCLICHASSQNEGLPGHLVRSVRADSEGMPILASGTYRIDHTSPLSRRWGGWYVSGISGKQNHLGNMIYEDHRFAEKTENKDGLNVTDLSKFFKTSGYLSPHSDIVALMVLEHQAQMHNLLTRANYLTRFSLYEEAELNKALGRTEPGHTESTLSRIRNAADPLVKYMLFSEEAKLTEPLKGTSAFADEFSRCGPRDKQGRSLRDFDSKTRIFKYPCSYLIYSPTFDQLPGEVKEYVYRRLWRVLSGRDGSAEFDHLSDADCRAIREILIDTKSDLPEYWKMKK
jgi:hypothetical protein